MAELNAFARRAMPRREFGQPGKNGFPMNDATHQRLAIGGATRSYNAGNISKGTEQRIQGEARGKLGPAYALGATARPAKRPAYAPGATARPGKRKSLYG